jgi:mevalonate kinase
MSPSLPVLADASAPGKAILLGEHAAVYGRGAVAVPLSEVESRAVVTSLSGPLRIEAPDLNLDVTLKEAGGGRGAPLAAAVAAALRHSGVTDPEWRVTVSSSVPMASGLGSSASVAVAVVRAVCRACGAEPDSGTVASLAGEADTVAHGRASGIDVAVIARGAPILFRSGAVEPLSVKRPVGLLVADTGEPSETSGMVARVAAAREAEPATYDAWLAHMGQLVDKGVRLLAEGDDVTLGRTMNQYHLVLQAMRLSSSALDALVGAARDAGALGAKLTGAGGGGSVVVLPRQGEEDVVNRALYAAGARRVYQCTVAPGELAPA